MNQRTENLRWRLQLLFVILVLSLSACFAGRENTSNEVILTEKGRLDVLSAPVSLEKVIAALNYHYNFKLPENADSWVEEDLTPSAVDTSAVFEYTHNDWQASVVYRSARAEETIYRLSLTNDQGLTWEGRVTAFGEVTQTDLVMGRTEAGVIEPSFTASPISSPSATPTVTTTPEISIRSQIDTTYRIEINYPEVWDLAILPAGRNIGTGFGAKTMQLEQNGIKLIIQYKFAWENTDFYELIPEGEIEIQRLATLLGKNFPMKFVLDGNKVVYQFFNASFEDLEFHIHIETSGEEIPEEYQFSAEQIIASITRSGDPVQSPTPSPIASRTPSSKLAGSRSGSGEGSSVDEDCNKAKFVSHVTIPEGTILPPNAEFIKTWRIQNTGNCTWTTAYRLVYSTGDLMGADKSEPLPETVSPGSSVDISVKFVSPSEEGHYQGYWVFNDPQGYWFGLGEQKNGFVPVDIQVMELTDLYAYDFAYQYCDAIWVNNQEQILPCPGSSGSSNGFVVLVANPTLENRNEDELALWVHPFEERYGWIQGVYPAYEVKTGDHFRSWVGCVADTAKCSLQFHLEYLDNNGDLFSLGSWVETLDGKVTEIDLDLSALVGSSVQFILRTEAITHNVDAAQGYWFVPRIENP